MRSKSGSNATPKEAAIMDLLTGIALAYKAADDTHSEEAPAFRAAVKSHLAKLYAKHAEAAKMDYLPLEGRNT